MSRRPLRPVVPSPGEGREVEEKSFLVRGGTFSNHRIPRSDQTDALLLVKGSGNAEGWRASGRLGAAAFGGVCPAAALRAGHGLLCRTSQLQRETLELRDSTVWDL